MLVSTVAVLLLFEGSWRMHAVQEKQKCWPDRRDMTYRMNAKGALQDCKAETAAAGV